MVFLLSYPYCTLVLSIFFSIFICTHQACNRIEYDSLLRISKSFTSSSQPLNWTSTIPDCCFWEGITCNQHNRVTHINLPSRSLTGTISQFFGNLSYLSHLNLSNNSLTETLPESLFLSLNYLQTLDLSYNDLVGGPLSPTNSSFVLVSAQMVDLSSNRFHGKPNSDIFKSGKNIVYFNISHNNFAGFLPASICSNHSFVQVFDFSFNDFNGQIPLGFGECTELEVLNMGFNKLSGLLPEDIYGALKLRQLSLPSNNLMGSISKLVIRLSGLTMLELHTNNFNGTLPSDIGKLSNLESLLLHMNQLSGTLPDSLFNCTNLRQLNLLSNTFQGNITNFDFSKMNNLTILDLGANKFTGQFPKSLYSCKSLKAIRASQNKLGGQITPDMLALQSLTFLALSFTELTNISEAIKVFTGLRNLNVLIISGNFINETLPSIIDSGGGGFRKLEFLSIGRCNLTGQVPTWLKKLHRLKVLDLAENRLRGGIPTWIGDLPSLFRMDLHGNFLSGRLPVTLTALSALFHDPSQEGEETYLDLPIVSLPQSPKTGHVPARMYNHISNMQPMMDLHNNSLTGTIPDEMGHLVRLIVLDLSRNEFSGKIPNHISDLSNLEILDLSHNRLSGEIPKSLGALNFLSLFNVSFNDLRGAIPGATQMRSLDASAFLGNPGLCDPPLGDCNKTRTGSIENRIEMEDDDDIWFAGFSVYVSIGVGFIVGFLGVWKFVGEYCVDDFLVRIWDRI